MSGTESDISNSGNEGSPGNIKDRAAEIAQQAKDVGQQARQAANEQYEHLRDSAQEYYQQGRDVARQWEQGLEQYVHEKPVQALLIAAGVGVLLGVLWKRH